MKKIFLCEGCQRPMISTSEKFIHGNRKRCRDECANNHKRATSRERQRLIRKYGNQGLINLRVIKYISEINDHIFPITLSVDFLINQGFRFDNGLIALTSISKESEFAFRIENYQIEYLVLKKTITINKI
jgi:hypothetical protein